jgi:hypothetical protein
MMSNERPSFSERFQSIGNKNKQIQEESNLEYYARNISQYGARAAEILVGMPGNYQKAFKGAWDYISNIHDDEDSYLKYAVNPITSSLMKAASPAVTKPLVKFPTSEDVREEVTKPLSKLLLGDEEYLEPKTKNEERLGEFTQDLTSFFTPGTGQMKLATRIGAPILGKLSEEGLKYLGVDESTAAKAKTGVMLFTTLAGQSDPGKFASQQIKQAKDMVPDTFVDVSNLEHSLIKMKDNLRKGLKVTSKNKTVSGIDDLLSQITGGRMNIKSLMEARDNINEWISEAGGWDIPGPVKKSSVRNLNELKSNIIKTTQDNLNRLSPKAADLYKTGYEAAAVNHQSNVISNFIEKKFGKKFSSTAAKVLFSGAGGYVAPNLAASGAALYPAYKAGQVLYRISKSPTLANYYADVIKYSTQRNASAMIKSLNKLDKELAKQEKEGVDAEISLDEFKSRFKNKG